jgi:hypothetical protein
MMHVVTKTLLVCGLITGAAAFNPVGGSAQAQGFYIDAPGVHVGVGERHRYQRYYYRHRGYRAYGYDPGHPYGYNYDYGDPRCGRPNYTIQDGVCKPYRGH